VTTFVIGDIHGHLNKLRALLQDLHLIDERLHWSGSGASIWFLGDYTDRGPDGVGVIELVMRLEVEAQAAGGKVGALLGNHDVIVLNAMRFPDAVSALVQGERPWTFRRMWLENAGGQLQDAEGLRPQHLDWLVARPALAKVGNTLLMHADSTFYLNYGKALEAMNTAVSVLSPVDNGRPARGSRLDRVNVAISELLHGHDTAALDRFEEQFASRRAFLPHLHGEDVALENALQVLNAFGAARLVHGHTPVFNVLNRPAAEIDRPFTYLNGLCTNVDPGLYAGGAGFALRLHDDGSPIS
jgi:Calcineurin-like phosphoesterase